MKSSHKVVDCTAHDPVALRQQVADVCRDIIDSWSGVHTDEIEVITISGGISNALYKVSIKIEDLTPAVIVLRVYGENTEKFVDRGEEVDLMQKLNKSGFGPQVMGTFNGGRIESYLHGLRCLEPEEIATDKYKLEIARTLAKFHSVSKTWNKPETIPVPFGKVLEWLHTVQSLDFSDDPEKYAEFKKIDLNAILREIEEIRDLSEKIDSVVVFSHNDLLSGNIMVPTDDQCAQPMTFIDFEYAGWAPMGFDLGNHFCEYAGFDCDYSKYPDGYEFVKEYLTAFYASAGMSSEQVTEDEIRRVVSEANLFALMAHLYWIAWALLQAKWSSIDFDYMSYANLRLHEYYNRKDEFIDEVKKCHGL